ncbi:MAG: glutathione S-transferase [Pseudomonadota bacterium]
MKLIIGNYTYSTWSMRPWFYIDHHNLPVEIERHCLFTDETLGMLDQHFSGGKVPLLLDGEVEVWDTLAILETLAERFPKHRGWPEDSVARSVARSVSAEMHSSFGSMRNDMPMNCKKYFPDFAFSDATSRDIHRIDDIWRYCRKKFGAEGPWLFGDFSIADAMYAPVVMRFRSFPVTVSDTSAEYMQTVLSSGSVRNWLQLSDSETEVLPEDEIDWPSVPLQS